MRKPYIYNLKTCTLHIEGFCHYTFEGKHYGNGYICFSSENEAKEYDGLSVRLCKLCLKEREKRIRSKK